LRALSIATPSWLAEQKKKIAKGSLPARPAVSSRIASGVSPLSLWVQTTSRATAALLPLQKSHLPQCIERQPYFGRVGIGTFRNVVEVDSNAQDQPRVHEQKSRMVVSELTEEGAAYGRKALHDET
jgi:hypothetical protein